MDHSAEHVREISSTLYKYHLDNFLCDVFIVLPDATEVSAHSVVLSAVSIEYWMPTCKHYTELLVFKALLNVKFFQKLQIFTNFIWSR